MSLHDMAGWSHSALLNFGIVGVFSNADRLLRWGCGCIGYEDSPTRTFFQRCDDAPHPFPVLQYGEMQVHCVILGTCSVAFERYSYRRQILAMKVDQASMYLQIHLKRHPRKLDRFTRSLILHHLAGQFGLLTRDAAHVLRAEWLRRSPKATIPFDIDHPEEEEEYEFPRRSGVYSTTPQPLNQEEER